MYENIDDNGRIVTCRKPHRCEWCDGLIAINEKAVVRKYKFGGDFNSSHMHPECYKAMERSFSKGLAEFDGSFWPEQGRGKEIGEDKDND